MENTCDSEKSMPSNSGLFSFLWSYVREKCCGISLQDHSNHELCDEAGITSLILRKVNLDSHQR